MPRVTTAFLSDFILTLTQARWASVLLVCLPLPKLASHMPTPGLCFALFSARMLFPRHPCGSPSCFLHVSDQRPLSPSSLPAPLKITLLASPILLFFMGVFTSRLSGSKISIFTGVCALWVPPHTVNRVHRVKYNAFLALQNRDLQYYQCMGQAPCGQLYVHSLI